MPEMTYEHKAFHFQLKTADDGQGIIEGYLSVFNVVDQGNDRVLPGAFKRTLGLAKKAVKDGKQAYLFPMLWQHDPDQPIGGVTDAYEDTYGLFTKAQFDLDTQRGREAYSGYKKGYLNQLSIGYDAVQKAYDEKGVRDLIELRLWEQSTVTFAMCDVAVVTDVKSASGSTSFPLAPRNTPWDKSTAIKDIEEATGNDWSKAAKYFFWVAKSPPETEADCKFPFVAKVDGLMKAVPEAIIAAAAALDGARG